MARAFSVAAGYDARSRSRKHRLSLCEQFRELRVALEKLRFVGRDLLEYLYGFVVTLILVLRQIQQNRKIPRFSNKPVGPFRVSEVFKRSRLGPFFDASRIAAMKYSVSVATQLAPCKPAV
jgi:hypothetical protein